MPLRYQDCCQPCHQGTQPALSAEQLMRSRFSAYVLRLIPYIADTYYQAMQSPGATAEIAEFANHARFLALKVFTSGATPAIPLQTFAPLPGTATELEKGYVHFQVWFLVADKLHLLEEHSRFVIEHGQWKYVDGVLLPHPINKVGRNDPCPCGSGHKFKACSTHWLNQRPFPVMDV
jgi:SEC-C motif-containing protein